MDDGPTRRWRASWIWPRDRREPNLHLLFRADVELDAVPAVARFHVAAESTARVILNGHELLRSAASSYPHQHYYDSLDCAHALVAGTNRIAVVVRYIGIPASASIPKDPGLLAELVLGAGDDARHVGSDASWRWLELGAWRGRRRRSEWLNLEQVEVVDHRLLPSGFPYPEDESGFAEPEALAWPGVRFTGLERRPFPRPVAAAPIPLRVLHAGTGANRDREATDPAGAISRERIEEDQILDWDGREPLAIPAPGAGRMWSALIDLGDYRSGRPELVVAGPAGAVVDLAWDERLDDGRIDLAGRRVGTADRHVLAAGSTRIVPEDWITGRYLQLTLRGGTAAMRIESLRYVPEAYPLHQRLRFATSDPRLDRIVAISLQAVRRCMHDNIMDCPWRERRQWIGDVQRIALINHYAFGDRALVRAVLRQHIGMQHPSGRMWCCVPIWEEFPTQSMEWLRAVIEYTRITGDGDLLAEVRPNAALLHHWFRGQRDQRGLLFIPTPPVCNWMDNPFGAIRGHQFDCPFLGQNLRYLGFLDDLVAGDVADAAAVTRERGELAEAIRAHFTDPATGLLRDCPVGGPWPATTSRLAHALAVEMGLVEGDEAAALWDRFEAHAAVAEPEAVIDTSPFGQFHVHRALARLGRDDAIVADILARWGPMVDAGADTTWEHFHDRGSRCHGWAGIPVVSLVGLVLGLDPSAPGRARREDLDAVAWLEAELD